MSRPMTRGLDDPAVAALTEEINRLESEVKRLRRKRHTLVYPRKSARRSPRPRQPYPSRVAWYLGPKGLRIEQLYLLGLTAVGVGVLVGCSRGTVLRVLAARGVDRRPAHAIATYVQAKRSQAHLCKDEVRA